VVMFHIAEYSLDGVTDENDNFPQNVHRSPRFEKMTFTLLKTGSDG
jgi:hypothetical protein